MADLGPVVAALMERLAPLTGRALSSILRTTVGMMLLSVVMAILTVLVAADGSWFRGGMATGMVVLACLVGWGILVGQRAAMTLAIHAFETVQLGRRVLDAVFERLFALCAEGPDSETAGARGSALARRIETVPLARAEAMLRRASESLINAPKERGGLVGAARRRVLDVAVSRIERVTLAEFRSQGSAGIDLVVVRDRLAAGVDDVLIAQTRNALRRLTMIVVGCVTMGCMLGAMMIRQI